MKLLIVLKILNISFAFQRPISMKLDTNINNKMDDIVHTLKTNNDNVFSKTPDLTSFVEHFSLTIENTSILDKTKYNSLYRTVHQCDRYISDVTVSNTFNYSKDIHLILCKSTCRFKFKFPSRHITIKMNSKYILNEDYKIIEHNILNVFINERQIDIVDIISCYFEKNKNSNSLIQFLFIIFTKYI